MEKGSLFTHVLSDGVLEIVLGGEIDHHSAVCVRGDIDRLIFESRPKRLVLDLSQVSFMDSSGLGLIMGRYSLIKELGGSLILRSPSEAVTRMLSLAGMDRMVRIENSSREDMKDEKE